MAFVSRNIPTIFPTFLIAITGSLRELPVTITYFSSADSPSETGSVDTQPCVLKPRLMGVAVFVTHGFILVAQFILRTARCPLV